MALPEEVLQWLYGILTPEYQNAPATYIQVTLLLERYPLLRPRTNVFTHQSGTQDLLLCLFGVLPCKYNGNEYRIPVEFWIPKAFPREAPMCFVRPTTDMLISPSRNVDINGRVYHPALAYWDPEQSNLAHMASELTNAFSLQPPVYAKPPQYPQSLGGNDRVPENPTTRSTTPVPVSPSYNQQPPNRPALPPKPPKPHELQSPPYQHTQHSTLAQSHSRQTSYGSPLGSPLPQSPSAGISVPQSKVMSILDMDDSEIPPQLPPNPGKQDALRHLEEKLDGHVEKAIKPKIDMDDAALTHTKETLDYYELAYERESSDLQNLERASDENNRILAERTKQARLLISEDIAARKVPHVDEIITTETVAFNQLYDLIAEDRAIDDTIYVLQRAFDSEKIQLEVFMKLIRSLAREQFAKRALWVRMSEDIGLNIPHST